MTKTERISSTWKLSGTSTTWRDAWTMRSAYVEDDEAEASEHVDAMKEPERVSQDPVPPRAPLTGKEAMFRQQRDLIFTHRSNLAVHGWDSKTPRHR
jgi:hypothetical protein